MFQKFGATIVEEENPTKKPAVKAKAPKVKVAAKSVAPPTDEDESTHYECFRF